MLKKLIKEIQENSDIKKVKILQKFFKTKKGEYGEGDIFLGLNMPLQRNLAKKYEVLSFKEIEFLIENKFHEYRMIGFLVLLNKYEKSKNISEKEKIFLFLIKKMKWLNNWDLVDVICPKTIGDFCFKKNNDFLKKLSKSKNLWEKRISIVSTYTYIKNNSLKETLEISKILLNDQHDLIHKAVGWMLREVGKKNISILENFLKENYDSISRTTLRYSIEKFPENKRKKYLQGKF